MGGAPAQAIAGEGMGSRSGVRNGVAVGIEPAGVTVGVLDGVSARVAVTEAVDMRSCVGSTVTIGVELVGVSPGLVGCVSVGTTATARKGVAVDEENGVAGDIPQSASARYIIVAKMKRQVRLINNTSQNNLLNNASLHQWLPLNACQHKCVASA